jgi:hydrogenase expression/formation protein HypC
MCLGIPGQVVERVEGYGDQLALVDVVGAQRRVNIGMLGDETVEPGDWVLIHVGFAVEKIDAAGAREALADWKLMGQPQDDAVAVRGEAPGPRRFVSVGGAGRRRRCRRFARPRGMRLDVVRRRERWWGCRAGGDRTALHLLQPTGGRRAGRGPTAPPSRASASRSSARRPGS